MTGRASGGREDPGGRRRRGGWRVHRGRRRLVRVAIGRAHGGGTGEGQRSMLEHLGVTEPAVRRHQATQAQAAHDGAGGIGADVVVLPHPGHQLLGHEVRKRRRIGQVLGPVLAAGRVFDQHRDQRRDLPFGDQVVQDHWGGYLPGISIPLAVEQQQQTVGAAGRVVGGRRVDCEAAGPGNVADSIQRAAIDVCVLGRGFRAGRRVYQRKGSRV